MKFQKIALTLLVVLMLSTSVSAIKILGWTIIAPPWGGGDTISPDPYIPPASCNDADGGLNWYVKGTTTFSSGDAMSAAIDQCNDDYYLREGYCDGTSYQSQTHYCPYGCEDGACNRNAPVDWSIETINVYRVSNVPEGTNSYRYEVRGRYSGAEAGSNVSLGIAFEPTVLKAQNSNSDLYFRRHYREESTVVASTTDGYWFYQGYFNLERDQSVELRATIDSTYQIDEEDESNNRKDYDRTLSSTMNGPYCVGDNQYGDLYENGVKIHDCQGECTGGTCDGYGQTECTDSDGGRNWNQRGTTESTGYHNNDDFTDRCVDNQRLEEGWCEDDDTIQTTVHDCGAYGCEDGACIYSEDDYFWMNQGDTVTLYIDSVITRKITLIDVTNSADSCGFKVDGSSYWVDVGDTGVKSDVVFGVYEAKSASSSGQGVEMCRVRITGTAGTLNCLDSDNGVSYYKYGEIYRNGRKIGLDNCKDGENGYKKDAGNYLWENYWTSDCVQKHDTFKCPNGCRDGACVDEVNETPVCTDSDGGKNVYESGVAGVDGVGSSGDYCDFSQGENILYEAYCVDEGTYSTERMVCPSGAPYCNKGKCDTVKPQCTETDGGKNPFILGTTYSSHIADHPGSTDYCQKTSTNQHDNGCSGSDCSVREFYCTPDSARVLYENMPCPNGCRDGACISEVNETPVCTDSDGGKKIYVAGEVEVDGDKYADKCVTEVASGQQYYAEDNGKYYNYNNFEDDSCSSYGCYIAEAVCNDADYFTVEPCRNGCQLGKCLSEDTKTQQIIITEPGRYDIVMEMYDASATSTLDVEVKYPSSGGETGSMGFSLGTYRGEYIYPRKSFPLGNLPAGAEVIVSIQAHNWGKQFPKVYSNNEKYFKIVKSGSEFTIFADEGISYDGGYNDAKLYVWPSRDYPAVKCRDSDIGKAYFDRGAVKYGTERETDSCTDCTQTCGPYGCTSQCNTVNEKFCANSGIGNRPYSCQYGCVLGECQTKEESESNCKYVKSKIEKPTRTRKWQSLGLEIPEDITIKRYKIQWFNGKWSNWYYPGKGDEDWKTNSDGSKRRVWAYFDDHVHQFELCVDKPIICKSDELLIDGMCKKNDVIIDVIPEETSCNDSDYGTNAFVAGTAYTSTESQSDVCTSYDTLQEFYCFNDTIHSVNVDCDYDCSNGACISIDDEIIIDETPPPNSSSNCPETDCYPVSDTCMGADRLYVEECKVYLDVNGECVQTIRSKVNVVEDDCNVSGDNTCTGCMLDGDKCLPIGTRLMRNGVVNFCSVEGTVKAQSDEGAACQNAYECKTNNCWDNVCTAACQGCIADDVCLPFGTRSDVAYCSSDGWTDFAAKNSECNNDFECSTNLCISNKCVPPSIWKKFTRLLKAFWK